MDKTWIEMDGRARPRVLSWRVLAATMLAGTLVGAPQASASGVVFLGAAEVHNPVGHSSMVLALQSVPSLGGAEVEFCEGGPGNDTCGGGHWITAGSDCWVFLPGTGGGASTAFASFNIGSGETLIVKIVDSGPGRRDRVGFRLHDGGATSDGACGAADLTTSLVAAGDFYSATLRRWPNKLTNCHARPTPACDGPSLPRV
jgi:hypothetical protein